MPDAAASVTPPAGGVLPDAVPVRTHLGWAVVVSALCFLPLGLVALAYGLRASSAASRGDLDRARRSSRAALGWIIATVVVGLLVDVALVAGLALLGAFSG